MIWLGSIVGVVCGVLHAVYVYRLVSAQQISTSPRRYTTSPAYYALWTLALWILMGSYVLAFWVLGTVLYVIFKAIR